MATNIAQLKEKSGEELQEQLQKLLREQLTYRIQKSMQQLKQTHLMKQTRREIARIKMVLGEERVKQDD